MGAELLRIPRPFEEIHRLSVVLIDELCSGTNSFEAIRIIGVVLELLRRSRATDFVTTHFLDYTHQLAAAPRWPELELLQALVSPAEPLPVRRPRRDQLAGHRDRPPARVTSEALRAMLDEQVAGLEMRTASDGPALPSRPNSQPLPVS